MKKTVYKVVLTVETGLHIGAGNDKMQIGGVDSPVIKDPVSNLPYIPGSSLKGKLRSLLETEGGYDNGEKNEMLNTLFGANTDYLKTLSEDQKKKLTPTRFIFRDLFLAKDHKEEYEQGIRFNETKGEVKISRSSGTADKMGPRFIERVPPWTEFEGTVLVRVLNGDDEARFKKVLTDGFELLKNDYLGGSGSRGYGAVTVTIE